MKTCFVYQALPGARAWCGRRPPVERQVVRADEATCAACWQAMGLQWAGLHRELSPPRRATWSTYRPPAWDEYVAGMSTGWQQAEY